MDPKKQYLDLVNQARKLEAAELKAKLKQQKKKSK